MLLSLVGLPIFAQTMVEIGTGTLGTATGTNYWPFGNLWENNKTQTLYLASELNTGGAATITKIAHNFERIATANNALTNFTVNFKTTSLTNLVAGAYTDMTGSVNVFSAPSFIPATATGWNEIDITDFAYDGTSNLIIEIAEFPSDDVFEDMALETPFDLLGLFEGRGISERFTVETGEMPNRITLYRRPILDYWAENEETLGDIITHVLIHEIGHHFGLSDDDMERIEASAEIAAG